MISYSVLCMPDYYPFHRERGEEGGERGREGEGEREREREGEREI